MATARPREHRLTSFADIFPYGMAPLVILLLAVGSGTWLAFNQVPRYPGDVSMWTFASPHYADYQKAIPAFEERTGKTVGLSLVHNNAINQRLRAAMWAGDALPDLVEVEITWAGSFFRGPAETIGFIPLDDLLDEQHTFQYYDPDDLDAAGNPRIKSRTVRLRDELVETRLAPFSSRGQVYGLPHDVHPVMFAYRRDLLEQGLSELAAQGRIPADTFARWSDPSVEITWEEVERVGRLYARREEQLPRGERQNARYLLNLSRYEAHGIEPFLFQRGGGYFNADGELIMDNEIAVETMMWFVRLVAGPDRIAADPGLFGQGWVRSVEDGYCVMFICPDWKSGSTELQVPGVSGRMGLMPLPVFEPGGPRTSTWGGTMLGITRRAKDPALAWEFARHLYLNTEDLADRFRGTNILPPFRLAWTHPAFHEPREYWGGQQIGTDYIALADDVPPQYGHPFLELAKGNMGTAMSACVNWYDSRSRQGPVDEEELRRFVRQALRTEADKVRMQIARNPF